VHELVGALRRRGRGLKGPEHRDTQGERHNYGEGDVKVLAHSHRLKALGTEHKEKLRFWSFAVKAKEAQDQRLGGSDKGQGSRSLNHS